MGDDRAIAYREQDDLTVVRASACGRSSRCLATALQGYSVLPAPAFLVKAADAGTRFEHIVKGRLRDQGWLIDETAAQHEVEVQVSDDPHIIIRGHLDGANVTIPAGVPWRGPAPTRREGFVLEIKSMSSRMWAKWREDGFTAFPNYAAQITTYMQAMSAPAAYVVVNRDTEELDFTYLADPPADWQTIRQTVLLAAWYGSRDELPSCTTTPEYWCPYDYICDRRATLFDEIESGTEEVLQRLAQEYDGTRRAMVDIEAAKEAARADLLEAMGERSKVQAGMWTIHVVSAERSTLDQAALQVYLAAHGSSLDEFKTLKPYTQLRVTGGSTQ